MKKWMMFFAAALCLALSCCALAEDEMMTAQQYTFELAAEEVLMIENTLFEQDVTIKGDDAQIIFSGCEFKGNVINTAKSGTRVMLFDNNEVHGQLIFRDGVKESNVDESFPKFMLFEPVPVVLDECIGSVIVLGTFDTVINGETFKMENSELFYDNSKPENGMVPYEGQEANCYVVAQWWENGEKKMLFECEYDPGS